MSIFEAIGTRDVNQVAQVLKQDPNCVGEYNNNGMTPLIYATWVLRGVACDPIVHALVVAMKAKGNNINEGDLAAGRSALHWAAYHGNRDFIVALQKYAGPDIQYYKRDNSDRMAHQLAESKGFVDVLETIAPERLKLRAGTGPVSLAIIGMGPAGAGLFIRLVRGLLETPAVFKAADMKQIKITLIDSKSALGTGTPYSSELNAETSVLNIPAAGMSIDALAPNDFIDFIVQRYTSAQLASDLGVAAKNGLRPASVDPKGYYPRLFYGQYVNARVTEWVAKARAAGIEVLEMPSTTATEHTAPDGKGMVLEVQTGKDAKKQIPVTHVYYATGHWEEELSGKPYEKASGTLIYPASKDTLIKQGILAQPGHIAIMGSSLSAIDAVFSILLDPAVGTLTWEGDEPTYVPIMKGFKITAYSRRGVWPRVRPQENVDKDPLQYTSPEVVGAISTWAKRPPTLEEGIKLLGLELDAAYGLPAGTTKPLQKADPLGAKPPGEQRNPFSLLADDVKFSDDGDGSTPGRAYVRWYQVIHALMPVMNMFYRGLSAAERDKFDAEVNTPFLWAFAPMPLRSARVLMAMHKAGVLDLHRIVGAPETKDNKNLTIKYRDYDDKEQVAVHPHMAVTTGLASKFYRDISPLTQSMMKNYQISFTDPTTNKMVKEGSIFMAEDNSFEILDAKGNHSPSRRGVGFFLHSQIWAIQAAPAVVSYGKQVAELYLGEFAARFNGPLNTFPRQHPMTAKL